MFEISWQDAVLTAGNLVFFAALIPSIMSTDKPSKWTSLSTAATLSLFSVAYATLGLSYGTFATGLTALAWWVLFYQKWRG